MTNLIRVTFVAAPGTGFALHDGKGKRPASMAEIQATWLLLGIRGHMPMPQIQGGRDPAFEGHLRELLKRPGRPSAAIVHAQWAARFRELYAELCAQHETYHVDGDQPPTKLGVAQLVADEFGVKETTRGNAARRVWNAVKPLI
jgi:hypothetical protein